MRVLKKAALLCALLFAASSFGCASKTTGGGDDGAAKDDSRLHDDLDGTTETNSVTELEVTAGGGQVSSSSYRLNLTAGGMSPSGTAASAHYRLTLGVPR
jgi:hypothetical protein